MFWLAALSACLLGQAALASEVCQPLVEYDTITKVVTDRFYDKTFRGLDWPARVAADPSGDRLRRRCKRCRRENQSPSIPAAIQNLTDDFSAQIAAFRKAEVDIVTGVVIPPDFTFWTQASQKGFRHGSPRSARRCCFRSPSRRSAGPATTSRRRSGGRRPTRSSLLAHRRIRGRDLARPIKQATGKPWTQPIGFAHALFEVAIDALKRSADPKDAKATIAAIGATSLDTLVGPIRFGQGVPPFARNVAKTPLVGGQWRLGRRRQYQIVVTRQPDRAANP